MFFNDFLMVIGGNWYADDGFPTEKCTIKNNGVTCKYQKQTLKEYIDYPELFLVPNSYCSL